MRIRIVLITLLAAALACQYDLPDPGVRIVVGTPAPTATPAATASGTIVPVCKYPFDSVTYTANPGPQIFQVQTLKSGTLYVIFGKNCEVLAESYVPPDQKVSVPVPAAAPTFVPLTASGIFRQDYAADWYWSPFRNTSDVLNDEATQQTFAEPGMLLDATAAYDRLSAKDTPVLVPEGGYAYMAVGAITMTHEGGDLKLDHQDGNIYLVIMRGLPDDATAMDLNQIVTVTIGSRGTGIYSPMSSGAYVSLGWFLQQVEASFIDSSNCGVGCQMVTVVVVDLKTHTYRDWAITDPKDSRNWSRIVNP